MALKETIKRADRTSIAGTVDVAITGQPIAAESKAMQPDGDIVSVKADGVATSTSSTLTSGQQYTSLWVDSDGWGTLDIFIKANVSSASKGIEVQFTDDTSGTPTVQASIFFEFNPVDVRRGFKRIPLVANLDGFRIIYTNGTTDQASFLLETTLRTNQSPALYNKGNAQVVADFNNEVAIGNISNYTDNVKFGAVLDVDTADTPCDIVSTGGVTPGLYTGFNATANEDIAISSSDVDDQGQVLESGTVTTGSYDQLIDSTATFVTNGVAIGDLVINDTQGIHGVIVSVDSETTVTVFEMLDGGNGLYANALGDSYRVANANDTGAAVVRVEGILNEDYEKQLPMYVILNGTTPVTLTVDAIRCSRGRVIIAGSTGSNEGVLTCNQATTTANVFFKINQNRNRTLNAASTVPAGKIFLIKRLSCGFVRSSGAAGSGFVAFNVMRYGEVWDSLRYESVSTNFPYDEQLEGGIVLRSGTDYKFTVESVSDNNTEVSAHLEHLEINR